MPTPQECTWCHVEIPSKDTERTKGFYGEVFGWTFQDIPEMDYTLYTTREGEMGGGILKWNEQIPQQMVNYVYVEDIPAVLQRIESSGGKTLHPETAVGEIGWTAWCADPDGNVFALWKANTAAQQ